MTGQVINVQDLTVEILGRTVGICVGEWILFGFFLLFILMKKIIGLVKG